MKQINISSAIRYNETISVFNTNLFCYDEKESKLFKDDMYKVIDNNDTYYIKKEDIKTHENQYQIKKILSAYKEKDLQIKKDILCDNDFENEIEKIMNLKKVEKKAAYKEYKDSFLKKCRYVFFLIFGFYVFWSLIATSQEHVKILMSVFSPIIITMFFLFLICEYFDILFGNCKKEDERINDLFYQHLIKKSEIKEIEMKCLSEKDEMLITDINMKDNINKLEEENILFKIQEKIKNKGYFINNM